MPIILMRLTTSHIFGLQKQGRGHATCYFESTWTIPSCKSNDKELVRVPLCHARPEISSCRNSQQLGKWIHFYDDDQEPGNASFRLVSQFKSFHLPADLLALHCTGSSHVSIHRPELAGYHYNTLNPSPWTWSSRPGLLTASQPRPFQATGPPRGPYRH